MILSISWVKLNKKVKKEICHPGDRTQAKKLNDFQKMISVDFGWPLQPYDSEYFDNICSINYAIKKTCQWREMNNFPENEIYTPINSLFSSNFKIFKFEFYLESFCIFLETFWLPLRFIWNLKLLYFVAYDKKLPDEAFVWRFFTYFYDAINFPLIYRVAKTVKIFLSNHVSTLY